MMALKSPDLDDRTFDELVEGARERIRARCPAWTDHSPGDPGTTLVETFAWLTETLLYRLNRLPHKVYVEFLRLNGVDRRPPHPAQVEVELSREDTTGPRLVPAGLRLRVAGGPEGLTFDTVQAAHFAPGRARVTVLALQGPRVEAELIGVGTGRPGASFALAHAPIPGDVPDRSMVEIGVEMPDVTDIERADAGRTRTWQGRTFAIWTPVDRLLGERDAHARVVRVDRGDGRVYFPPAGCGAVPSAGREIRAWYRVGSPLDGNVGPGRVDGIIDDQPGLRVHNTEAAAGWAPQETVDAALRRGPAALRDPSRVIVARDYERLALDVGGVARAWAVTAADLWRHAQPGTVELLIAPAVTVPPEARLTRAALHAGQTNPIRDAVQREVDARRPLGITCVTRWARFKPVSILATVITRPSADTDALHARLEARLRALIDPIGTGALGFGETLRQSHVYQALLADADVRQIERVAFLADDTPIGEVRCLAADHHQPNTCFAGSEGSLHRTMDGGQTWATVWRYDRDRDGPGDAPVCAIACHPQRPGWVAVAVELPTPAGAERRSWVAVSRDLGESWASEHALEIERVNDMAWLVAQDESRLLLATDDGLVDVAFPPRRRAVVEPIGFDQQRHGFHAIAVHRDGEGPPIVAAAAREAKGIAIFRYGSPTPPRHLEGVDIRRLAVEVDGARAFLWAGSQSLGGSRGEGCHRIELRSAGLVGEVLPFAKNWKGGSCLDFAFAGKTLFACTETAGILRLGERGADAAWVAAPLDSGLPLSDAKGPFSRVDALVVVPEANGRIPADGRDLPPVHLLAAGTRGVFSNRGGEPRFTRIAGDAPVDVVTLPRTWLFTSGTHRIELRIEHDGR